MAVAVIDKQMNVVRANEAFTRRFGVWKGRRCYDVYKDRSTPCESCRALETFHDGVTRVSEESGFDTKGQRTLYVKHTFPIRAPDGSIPYLVEMSTDVSDLERMRLEHETLFERVPCDIVLIDRDLNIVRANRRVVETFGQVQGRRCYEVFKGSREKCDDCPAQETFRDGRTHSGPSMVRNMSGQPVHLHVTTTALGLEDDRPDLVMEMAVDVTETLRLRRDLDVAHAFLQTFVASTNDSVIGFDAMGQVTLCNPSATRLLGVPPGHRLNREGLESMLPPGFLARVAAASEPVELADTVVFDHEHNPVDVRLTGIRLRRGDEDLGTAVALQDLRTIKRLEKEKLVAERLAAVGQTVAGLAHGIKNLMTGLEGGMYMLDTGLRRGNAQRIQQGFDMLARNVSRISSFVKDFLSFSKGRTIAVARCDPGAIADEVVALYALRARALGIELTHERVGEVPPAPLDREGLHEALTNLVGNAIDACQMSEEKRAYHVTIRTLEREGAVVFEVRDDGCGMDYDVKKKVFTTFFTTKGLGGTGLGLLSTRKIVQEHGGQVDVESEPGKGTTFRVRLPRHRLPSEPSAATSQGQGAGVRSEGGSGGSHEQTRRQVDSRR
jgi:PAS domain S-box-containing protein